MSDKLPIEQLISMLRKAEKELCEFQGLKPGCLIKLAYSKHLMEKEKDKKFNGSKL